METTQHYFFFNKLIRSFLLIFKVSVTVFFSSFIGAFSSLITGCGSGSSGSSGVNGSSGTSGVDGSSGSSGANGSYGTSGSSGVNGSSGSNGSSGTSGINGTPKERSVGFVY